VSFGQLVGKLVRKPKKKKVMAGVGGVVNGRGERGRQGNNRQTEKSESERERERESLSVFVFSGVARERLIQ
jgi:hypothetical protein